ncbi:NAD(P)H-dependent oxidoreductase [Levilactobacillus acidifarinae]|uniref:FMN dependent NADH:quinone oxidoreductase n=1 Tax=Levilactobacillus acidifarinae DSM 19394 = JCM 15949 TaxID=1423715 RepID=A0A0R1LUJ4_9LACO|nr:NAD(P)H-dependent oxidoreductase [Levilactobacillus acidifarinae]KRK96074.1 FMN-dependent NADH-azoreductase 2 [Levilactobacillus acidifarinae DSM 19394]GEO69652.1 FMN-dependent NADH-azoreductase 2 [Levilactobacillus acidifarinae]
MTNLLMILAHPHTPAASVALTVATTFRTAYQQAHPTDTVTVRDLYATNDPVPALGNTVFEAWRKQKLGEPLTTTESQTLTRHQAWLAEFMHADKVVFVNPMYNHFLPAELKQYIDLTAVARQTFKYTPQGPVGLLPNTKVLHIQSAGGFYHSSAHPELNQTEFGDAYLQDITQLYGITAYQSLFIEGLDQLASQRPQLVTDAQHQARVLADTF